MNTPRYKIRLQGKIGRQWATQFSGLTLTWDDQETHLIGPIRDQAELHGILNRIRDLGVTLIAVNQLAEFGVDQNNL